MPTGQNGLYFTPLLVLPLVASITAAKGLVFLFLAAAALALPVGSARLAAIHYVVRFIGIFTNRATTLRAKLLHHFTNLRLYFRHFRPASSKDRLMKPIIESKR